MKLATMLPGDSLEHTMRSPPPTDRAEADSDDHHHRPRRFSTMRGNASATTRRASNLPLSSCRIADRALGGLWDHKRPSSRPEPPSLPVGSTPLRVEESGPIIVVILNRELIVDLTNPADAEGNRLSGIVF